MKMDLQKLAQDFVNLTGRIGGTRLSQGDLKRLVNKHALRTGAAVFGAYIVASVIGSLVVGILIDTKSLVGGRRLPPARIETVSVKNETNYRDLKKTILDRNLFSREGIYPDEPDPSAMAQKNRNTFDENAPCVKTTLALTLLGTIYLGRTGDSLATVKDNNYEYADVYRKGDAIFGSETTHVHAIEPNLVVLNNDGTKECLELQPPSIAGAGSSIGEETAQAATGSSGADAGGCTTASLSEAEILQGLGDGDSVILQKGRLIPFMQDGQHAGFKLVGVDPSSLFSKVCLQNGDVVTQVNSTTLTPVEGYAIYEALRNERSIRLSVLRNGSVPVTINVSVR